MQIVGICSELCITRYLQPSLSSLPYTFKKTLIPLPHHCLYSVVSLQEFTKLCSLSVGLAWEEPAAPTAFIQSLAVVPPCITLVSAHLSSRISVPSPCVWRLSWHFHMAPRAPACPNHLFLPEERNRRHWPLQGGPGTSHLWVQPRITSACSSFGVNPNSGRTALAFSRGNRHRFWLASTIISYNLANRLLCFPLTQKMMIRALVELQMVSKASGYHCALWQQQPWGAGWKAFHVIRQSDPEGQQAALW